MLEAVAEPRKPEKGLKLHPKGFYVRPTLVAEPRKPEKGLKHEDVSVAIDFDVVAEPRKPEKGLKLVSFVWLAIVSFGRRTQKTREGIET